MSLVGIRHERRRDHRPIKQGELDGLCGFYCLVNFLTARMEKNSEKSMIFSRLLRCMDQREYFSASFFHDGYTSDLIEDVAVYFFRESNIPFKVVPSGYLMRKVGMNNFREFACEVFRHKGELLVNIDRGRHSVLAYAYQNGRFLVDDSNPIAGKTAVHLNAITEPGDGLAFLPGGSSLTVQ